MEDHIKTVDQLLNDPAFRKWVLSPESEEAQGWQSWIDSHAEHRAIVEEAKELLLGIQPKVERHRQAEEKVWSAISEGIQEKEAKQYTFTSHAKSPVWKVAASITIGLLSTAILYLWLSSSSYISVTTTYGEMQEVKLPDSSWVVLNANSSLRYEADWEEGIDREVWLEGEAFFKVEKKLSGSATQSSANSYIKFTVHADPLDVEVIGTEFSVNHRAENTQVVLNEGIVRVKDMREKQEEIMLKPGEMLSYNNKVLQLSQVDASTKISWKDELVIFNDEPLSKIFKRIEDTYGYTIRVSDKAILERRFSGSYPRDTVKVLLDKMEKLYQLNITENDRQIIIDK
ncbi:transmembrane sensor [Catalinimonas alkaloidigena]|uniref:FecR family protein n=1 Tax=Catalinimonas alkaloidigena TaxID=1075417 RepID=UPI0024054286|nr:FecR domain-containing protein [Catalinimonas alkaloidigena]MDF9797069.1 transmembrane sensor [Catalinimonas alkaloidigena]